MRPEACAKQLAERRTREADHEELCGARDEAGSADGPEPVLGQIDFVAGTATTLGPIRRYAAVRTIPTGF